MQRLNEPVKALVSALALVVVVGGCGSSKAAITTGGPVTTAATSAGDTALGAKVNANTATPAQLEAAFVAAGVTHAARWAKEVGEYRPYPKDPTLAKLRYELSKYNISPDELDKIVAALEV